MRCPNCDFDIYIEDWEDDSPFECPDCSELLKINTDEGTYLGATHSTLIILNDDE